MINNTEERKSVKKKEPKNEKYAEKQLKELIEVSKSAVIGYEKYLKYEINYQDLARIMTNLRKYLPMGATGSNEK